MNKNKVLLTQHKYKSVTVYWPLTTTETYNSNSFIVNLYANDKVCIVFNMQTANCKNNTLFRSTKLQEKHLIIKYAL